MKGKLLPIGTVVSITGGTKNVMITGYYSKSDKDGKIYTYNGCIFPEGFMENVFLFFDQYEIEDVIYMGYEDENFERYRENLGDKISITNGNIVKNNDTKLNNGHASHRRKPKAPTNPLSKSEMHAKFTNKKVSNDGSGDIIIPVRRDD